MAPLREAVISTSVNSIKTGITQLIENYDDYQPFSIEEVASFSWIEIANRYKEIICNILENK